MALTFVLLVFAVIVLRHGWVGDDAYITVRTVDNIFAGHGLVWNVGERVQAYTHPLWMLLLCGVHAITGEFFYSMIVLGVGVSTLALALVSVRLARSEAVAIALVVLATLSLRRLLDLGAREPADSPAVRLGRVDLLRPLAERS